MDAKKVLGGLLGIQTGLKAPKSQYNSFGKYKYRNCEDILEAVKPMLAAHHVVLTITDNVEVVGDRVYITATAMAISVEDGSSVSVKASAREPIARKGMDDSQITGASSSYARKYALSGLLLIDDTNDSDGTNTHGNRPDELPPYPDDSIMKNFDAWVDAVGNKKITTGEIIAKISSRSTLTQDQIARIKSIGEGE